jgi:hypothetical protein
MADLPDIGPFSASAPKLQSELVSKYGDGAALRISQGIRQVIRFWREEDGNRKAFEEFIRNNFIGDSKTLDETFNRIQFALEQLDGRMLEIGREFRRQSDLDLGPILPIDQLLAEYDPAAHVNDDFFQNKLAFIVLLNFPLTTLEERLAQGEKWSRRQWAEARLAQRFSRRIPASVNQELSKAVAKADQYIAEYNIWMHHLIDTNGTRLFPARLRLISHWNLRDELKADYSDPNGLAKQKLIQQVMERIVTQTIPEVVIDNPHVDWNPYDNEVRAATVLDSDSSPPFKQPGKRILTPPQLPH